MGWIDEVNETNVGELASLLKFKKTRGNGLSPCPACGAEHRGSTDKRGPVGVRGDDRGWRCFVCDAAGDTVELLAYHTTQESLKSSGIAGKRATKEKAMMLGLCSTVEGRKRVHPSVAIKPIEPTKKVTKSQTANHQNSRFRWHDNLVDECASALWKEEGATTLAYMMGRGFTEDTLKEWRIGAFVVVDKTGTKREQYVTIPVFDKIGKPVNIRFRSVPGKCLWCDGKGCARCGQKGEVKKIYLRSPGRPTTLFGVHNLDIDKSETIICEGELDVIALWQYGFKSNVVSGTAGAGTWNDEWLDTLEPYKHFIIAYDVDEAGKKGAKSVADKLGRDRCSIANLPANDLADCLQGCISSNAVQSAFDNAQPLLEAGIVTVDSYINEIEELIASPGTLRGVPTGSQKLDQAVGGWQPGLVVITGDTAAGKTSFVTWLALEQARRGVGVLLTSFEQRPIGTVQKLLRAEVGKDFTEVDPSARSQAMNTLGSLPLYIVDHYGHLPPDQMRDLLGYAVRRRDVRWAMVDHLGFMVSDAEDERRAIEAVVREYATLSIQLGITIVLICHPNNMSIAQQRRVMLGDLKGASAIRQDAHVGLVVERILPGRTVQHPAAAVHVDKCRSEFGLQGARVTLFYDPQSCVYADRWEDTPAGIYGGTGGFPMPPNP